MGILDLISLAGRLLPRVTRVAVILVFLFFPALAAGIVLEAGHEEGARVAAIIHKLVQRELKQARERQSHSSVGEGRSSRKVKR